MLIVSTKLPAPQTLPVDEELVLAWDDRKRGRLRTTTLSGKEVGLFLERGKVLQHGDLLRAETGEVLQVVSASESVTTASTDDPLAFARICYHLGNRHVPLQVGNGWIRFQRDYVLEDLVRLYGLTILHEKAPFEPENGAYGEHGHHHPDHSDALSRVGLEDLIPGVRVQLSLEHD